MTAPQSRPRQYPGRVPQTVVDSARWIAATQGIAQGANFLRQLGIPVVAAKHILLREVR